MTVNDIIIRAINYFYNDPGTASSFLTPDQVAAWIDKAVQEYWGMFLDNEFGYYRFSEQTLSISNSTNVYSLPNGSDSITTLDFAGTPTSGTYVMTVNGVAITVSYNSTASSLQTAINTAFATTSTVTGGAAPTQFSIDWGFIVNTFTAVNTLLNTSSKAVAVTPVTTNLNVAMVTAMAIRQGSGSQAAYTPVPTILPTTKYGTSTSLENAMLLAVNNIPGGPLNWCQNDRVTSSTGFPTMRIRFVPWPTQSNTIVYDGIRYPDTTYGKPVTTIPDLPLHWHDGLVWRVLRDAYIRAKADPSGIEKEIIAFDKTQIAAELRSIQRQGPDLIMNTRGAW